MQGERTGWKVSSGRSPCESTGGEVGVWEIEWEGEREVNREVKRGSGILTRGVRAGFSTGTDRCLLHARTFPPGISQTALHPAGRKPTGSDSPDR